MAIPVLALTVALLAATPSQVGVPKDHGIDAVAIPLVSYNTDLGVGLGAVGGVYVYKPGHRPYQHGIAAQVYFTTRGAQSHWIRYDGPRLIGNLRLDARLDLRRELYAPYFGAGNRSAPGVVDSPSGRDRRFAFEHLSPGGGVRLRGTPIEGAPLQLYVGYSRRYTRVRTYPGSLLAEEPPAGLRGGHTGQLHLGALIDTRDHEADPTRGGLEELSFRGAALPTGSRYTYGGITLSERRFIPLGSPRWVFAQRVLVDVLFGEVPFFEWSLAGGLQIPEGIGGMGTVRGVPRNRYLGLVKGVSNSELRFYPVELPLLGAPVKAGGLVYLDLGRVWHPGTADGPCSAWHPGVGAGLRLSRRAAVLRLDYGLATESRRSAVYVTFGQMF